MTSCIALVVAAGRGTRLGAALPKQYLPVAGEPLLRHALRALASHPRINGVRAVIHPDDGAHYAEAARDLGLLPPVPGGAQRQDSVRLGLESLIEIDPDVVAIHDGARPFVDGALIDRVLDAVEREPGAIPALPVADTIKRGLDGRVVETVERRQLWRAQTPQAFRFREILAAHRAARGLELSDDAAVAERAGLAVSLVMGSEANLKVTAPEDLARAETLVLAQLGDIRTGQGFDVHPLGPGDHVWLCGIKVPHERALIGHSDADVGLHAITDAILGALGAGDIGQHFSPSDARWHGAASDQFLRHAAALVAERGGRVAHVDVTLICERPKVSPHRPAMIARIAEILGLAPDRVSVKATTTEKLGFAGREEGIAAQAIATVRLPGGP